MTIPFYCALQKYRVLALTHIGLPQLHNKITLLREAQLDQFSLVGIETGWYKICDANCPNEL